MVRASGQALSCQVTTCTKEEPPSGCVSPFPSTQVSQIALKSPLGSPVPPWTGYRLPFFTTNCTLPTGTSSGSFAARRSLIASPSAVGTSGSAVLSPFGVCTGSDASNCVFHHGATWIAPYAVFCIDAARWSQNRRNRIAPRESTFSCRSHFFSTAHALPTATGPDDDCT